MDLSENRTQHPNLIASALAHQCVIGSHTYRSSIIIPSDAAIIETSVQSTTDLSHDLMEQLCAYSPEVIIIATGDEIIFPEAELLNPLVVNNIGLEVLSNQAAARTFNVLLAESRQTVCLMMINN